MPSASLLSLRRGLLEVDELRRADPTPPGDAPTDPEISRAVCRASVVLLSSHFERYIYAVNEEAAEALNQNEIFGHLLPELLRLVHSQHVVDALFATGWEHRSKQLVQFVEDEAWLWEHESAGYLEHKRILAWMKAPTPDNLARYFRYWGVKDVFAAVTRAPHTKSELWLRIDELVGKRNNIAHGDLTVEATQSDLEHYRIATQTFCERVDRLMARVIGKMLDRTAAW